MLNPITFDFVQLLTDCHEAMESFPGDIASRTLCQRSGSCLGYRSSSCRSVLRLCKTYRKEGGEENDGTHLSISGI